jgi:hypothetical protein
MLALVRPLPNKETKFHKLGFANPSLAILKKCVLDLSALTTTFWPVASTRVIVNERVLAMVKAQRGRVYICRKDSDAAPQSMCSAPYPGATAWRHMARAAHFRLMPAIIAASAVASVSFQVRPPV